MRKALVSLTIAGLIATATPSASAVTPAEPGQTYPGNAEEHLAALSSPDYNLDQKIFILASLPINLISPMSSEALAALSSLPRL